MLRQGSSKERLIDFEEKRHDGKEESIRVATKNAQNTRMLGTRIGKLEDRAAWVKRGFHAWSKVKRWIKENPFSHSTGRGRTDHVIRLQRKVMVTDRHN